MTHCTVSMEHPAPCTSQIVDNKQTTTTTTATRTTLVKSNDETTEPATTVASSSDVIPDEFICPITLSIMTHPLVTRAGQNFERSAILLWLSQSKECPLTRQPMKPSDLIPNRALEARIGFWKQQQKQKHDNKAATAVATVTTTATDEADDDDNNDDDDDDDPIHSLVACAFLPVSEEKHNEVMARAAYHQTLRFKAGAPHRTTVLDAAAIAHQGRRGVSRSDDVILATAVLPPATSNNANARRPGETRRSFLSRILTMAHHELKE